ncbi:Polyketide synthase [Metarhizium humberi]|uniref:Polyketide synthase n=1 Tax=Metarhizium humberi TaxID=2596975 RepID=A0A9P8S652_9HYPO|nr:Polyketide synthase [Metarhizium humberi]
MDVSLENRDYCCVEISQMRVEKPEIIAALLRYNNAILRAGHVQPIWLAQVDAADRIQDASRYMQQGNHIGKMMVNGQESGVLQIGSIKHLSTAPARQLSLVSTGAQSLAFSRNGGSERHDEIFKREIRAWAAASALSAEPPRGATS